MKGLWYDRAFPNPHPDLHKVGGLTMLITAPGMQPYLAPLTLKEIEECPYRVGPVLTICTIDETSGEEVCFHSEVFPGSGSGRWRTHGVISVIKNHFPNGPHWFEREYRVELIWKPFVARDSNEQLVDSPSGPG